VTFEGKILNGSYGRNYWKVFVPEFLEFVFCLRICIRTFRPVLMNILKTAVLNFLTCVLKLKIKNERWEEHLWHIKRNTWFFAVEYINKTFDNFCFCLYIPLHVFYGSFHCLSFIEISLLSHNLFCSSEFLLSNSS
jgi:hypothetical protein